MKGNMVWLMRGECRNEKETVPSFLVDSYVSGEQAARIIESTKGVYGVKWWYERHTVLNDEQKEAIGRLIPNYVIADCINFRKFYLQSAI